MIWKGINWRKYEIQFEKKRTQFVQWAFPSVNKCMYVKMCSLYWGRRYLFKIKMFSPWCVWYKTLSGRSYSLVGISYDFIMCRFAHERYRCKIKESSAVSKRQLEMFRVYCIYGIVYSLDYFLLSCMEFSADQWLTLIQISYLLCCFRWLQHMFLFRIINHIIVNNNKQPPHEFLDIFIIHWCLSPWMDPLPLEYTCWSTLRQIYSKWLMYVIWNNGKMFFLITCTRIDSAYWYILLRV